MGGGSIMYLWESRVHEERVCSEDIDALKKHIEDNYTLLGGEITYESDDVPINVLSIPTKGMMGGLKQIGVIKELEKI